MGELGINATEIEVQIFVLFMMGVSTFDVSLGEWLVPAHWKVRVFGKSIYLDGPLDCLYVRSIPLSGCMVRRSC